MPAPRTPTFSFWQFFFGLVHDESFDGWQNMGYGSSFPKILRNRVFYSLSEEKSEARTNYNYLSNEITIFLFLSSFGENLLTVNVRLGFKKRV